MESFLGIDIGSSHSKIVEILLDGDKYILSKFALFPTIDILKDFTNAPSSAQKNSIDYLRGIIADAGFKSTKAYIALPEFRILTKVLELPHIEGDKNIRQAIEFEAAEHLPVNLSEMTIKFNVIQSSDKNNQDSKLKQLLGKDIVNKSDHKGTMEVLLVAAPTLLVENLVLAFNKVGLEIVAMEPTSIATSRVVADNTDIPTVLMEFGHEYVDFVLLADQHVKFVRSIKLGVFTFIRTLSQEMGLSQSQAENYLFTYGLNQTQLDGKIRHVIEPAMGVFIQELDRFIKYVESRVIFADSPDTNKVKRLVLAGGGALIPNFIIYLIEKVGLEVDYADPWEKVDISQVQEISMLKILGPLFTTSVGIVLK